MLKKKEDIEMSQKSFGCCGGLESKRISRHSIICEYNGSVIDSDRLLKEGMIQILKNAVRFYEKSWNPFYREI